MTAWHAVAAACRAGHDAFRAALADPAAAQAARLRAILAANAASEVGRRYGFQTMRGWDDYRAAVPISGYADIAAGLGRMAAGLRGGLTSEPAVACELTSGSGAAAKRVPYTEAGLAAFRRALEPWLFDLVQSRPRIADGRAYWAISPVGRCAAPTEPGAPVGTGDDSLYLGPTLAPLLAELLAAPTALGQMSDIAAWRYHLLRYLLDAEDLSFLSVWSPTFLLPLFDTIAREGDRLAYDIEHGTVSWPTADPAAPSVRFEPRPQRARTLRRALAADHLDVANLWPRVDTVSCWTHAGAARFIGELERFLPGVHVQGKGLLATEAAVSLPLEEFAYPVLALNSACYEFIDDAGASHLAHEVKADGRYRVVVTTDSGLYRYDLADTVRVRGFAARTPMLEFVGRAGLVGDLCGEKLAEDFAASALGDLHGFAMLAHDPDRANAYVLLLDAREYDESAAVRAAQLVEDRLHRNPHYAYARQLQQLDGLAAVRIQDPLAGLVTRGLDRGIRLGDIKPTALHPSTDWRDHFTVVPSQRHPTEPARAGTRATGVTQ
jgi:hypothetical protein